MVPDARAGECDHSTQVTVPRNPVTGNPVCLISWNSRGSSHQKIYFLSHLVSPQIVGNKIPILCNQENFILKANSYRIVQALPGFHCFINPAVKDVQDRGRPMNGMFIAVPDSIKSFIKDVSPNHWRVQALLIESSSSKTLLINSYFPFDTRRVIESDELTETIEVVKSVIEDNDCDAVMWAGDINSDFTRNNTHTKAVREVVEELNLKVSWETFPIDFTCTTERDGGTFTSILDHIFMSEQIADSVLDAGVIHHHENSSDHEPVYCVLSTLTLSSTSSQEAAPQSRPSWKKATLEERQLHEATLLTAITAKISLNSLLKTAEHYCNSHGLNISTDRNPKNSKTKCIAWLTKERDLPKLKFCGNTLPWVTSIKHPGNTIINKKNVMEEDILVQKLDIFQRT